MFTVEHHEEWEEAGMDTHVKRSTDGRKGIKKLKLDRCDSTFPANRVEVKVCRVQYQSEWRELVGMDFYVKGLAIRKSG